MDEEKFKSIWLKIKWHKYLTQRAIKKSKELNKIISAPKMLEIILEEDKQKKCQNTQQVNISVKQ